MCKQFGIGHDFFRNSTGWKWKVTSAFGLPGVPEVCQKTKVPIFPGLDVNVDWNTQYEFPELQGYENLSLIYVWLSFFVVNRTLLNYKYRTSCNIHPSFCISMGSFCYAFLSGFNLYVTLRTRIRAYISMNAFLMVTDNLKSRSICPFSVIINGLKMLHVDMMSICISFNSFSYCTFHIKDAC